MSSPKKPVVRRDATGHLDPEYERKLLEASQANRSREGDGRAFIDGAAPEELSKSSARPSSKQPRPGKMPSSNAGKAWFRRSPGGPFVPSTAGPRVPPVARMNPILRRPRARRCPGLPKPRSESRRMRNSPRPPPSSEITSPGLYARRREFIKSGALFVGSSAALGSSSPARCSSAAVRHSAQA